MALQTMKYLSTKNVRFKLGEEMLKRINSITGAATLLLLAFFSGGAFSQTKPKLVDFENLGEPLNLEKRSPKEKSTLKKLKVEEDSYMSQTRIVEILGAPGKFVLSQRCNATASGREEGCELETLANLGTSKSFDIPKTTRELQGLMDEKSIQIWYRVGDSQLSATRFQTTEKGQLSSLIFIVNNVKKFKGKASCSNHGSIIDVDAMNSRLTVRVDRKALGVDCIVEKKNKDGQGVIDDVTFFDRQAAKMLSN